MIAEEQRDNPTRQVIPQLTAVETQASYVNQACRKNQLASFFFSPGTSAIGNLECMDLYSGAESARCLSDLSLGNDISTARSGAAALQSFADGLNAALRSGRQMSGSLLVIGYTDSVGAHHSLNLGLAKRRAEVVSEFISEKIPSFETLAIGRLDTVSDPEFFKSGTARRTASRRVDVFNCSI